MMYYIQINDIPLLNTYHVSLEINHIFLKEILNTITQECEIFFFLDQNINKYQTICTGFDQKIRKLVLIILANSFAIITLTFHYFNRQFDAATPSDLWSGLQTAVDAASSNVLQGQTVQEVMETWNSKAGYPVVNVERENGVIVLSQVSNNIPNISRLTYEGCSQTKFIYKTIIYSSPQSIHFCLRDNQS